MDLITGYFIPFLLVLSVVVFVHEFGHYAIARLNGVRIEVFSIGFGPELFGLNDKAGTRWKFAALPLGGYVKMFGDADAASARTDAGTAGHPDSFPAKTVWQRMAIVVAGPLANLVFAVVVLAALYSTVGRPFAPAEVGTVRPNSPAAAAGLVSGDRIVAVDGDAVGSFQELQQIIALNPAAPLGFEVRRGGETLRLTVTPERVEEADRFGTTRAFGRIGVERPGVMEYVRSNPLTAVGDAVGETGRIITTTLQALGQMVTGARGTEELGGPLRIAQMSGQIAQDGVVPLIWWTAMLSINLGLINLFPIPLLDGGHLVFYAVEAGRGRPLTERSQEVAFRFGLALVLTLMVFATWNDIVQIF